MKELLLIPLMAAVFVFGFYIITRVDRLVETNRRLITEESRSGQSKVRIAAENPQQLERVAAALENCSEAAPHIAFFLSTGRASCLLEKLQEEQVDILLLADSASCRAGRELEAVPLCCGTEAAPAFALGLPVEAAEPQAPLFAVWKKTRRSKDRDRVIFALENQYRGPGE